MGRTKMHRSKLKAKGQGMSDMLTDQSWETNLARAGMYC